MSARTAGLLLWLTLGGLAALSLVWQIGNPPQPPMIRPLPPPELPAVAPLERFQLSPPDWYGEMTARPLFIADRRPEPPPPDDAAPEKPPAGPEQKFMLFGVMIAPGTQAALLRAQEPNAKTARIKLGEMIGEWRLDAVFPDRVVLRKGRETQDLPLTRPRKPAKPRAKRAGTQPAQQDAASPTNKPVLPANTPIGPGVMPAMPQPDGLPPPVGVVPPQ
ncbi:MAG: pilus assembly protein PilZ [Proteobacteria bacterium]|jgi:hypothetical protein|nr:pilus assembly protein PilZ [Pseudomonadota bacterium]MCU0808017.1 hypothetical protein [Candidatus Contendobacter sp.]